MRVCANSVAALILFCISGIVSATPQLTFGPLGQGVQDGTAPFGNVDLTPCASATDTAIAGVDCGDNNRVVRSQDIATHLWSVSANGGPPTVPNGDPILDDVVIEQTITPSENAVISFEELPAICKASNGGGTNPPSAIVDNNDGSWTMTCNLGPFSEGQAKLFTVGVKPSGLSWNGSTYTTTQRVYSLDSDGNSNSTANTYVDNTPITISSAPAYDLIHSLSTTHPIRRSSVTTMDVGQGVEPGFLAYQNIRLAATRQVGVESVTQPIVINDTFVGRSGSENGPIYPLEFHIVACAPNIYGWSGEVLGTYHSTSVPNRRVLNSGTCSYERDNAADPTSTSFTVTLEGADLSGDHYPTEGYGSVDLSAGPYYVMNHYVRIFVPFRSIDMVDGVLDNSGVAYLSSQLNGFDPISPSGTSNFGTGVEPGYNGADIGADRSNNILSPAEFLLVPRGAFSKRNVLTANNAGTPTSYTGSTYHAGDGEREPGQFHAGWVYTTNNGTVSLNNPNLCDVFDNTTQKLADRGNIGATAGSYAYIGTAATSGFDYTNYVVEYANIDTSGDDPLDGNGDGSLDKDVSSGRYNGNWSKLAAARCENGSATSGWHSNPTQVTDVLDGTSGLDAVNAVRVVLSPAAIAAGVALDPAHSLRLIVPLEARDRFNKGPHDGQLIPVGTVMPNFGGFKSDEWANSWTGRNYEPAPQNSSQDGDRVTLVRLKLTLDSESLTPVATPGQTASVLAGNQIVWKVTTALQSLQSPPSDGTNVQIISELPPEATYNAACTAAQTDGTPAGQVLFDTDRDGNSSPGSTLLIWNLGDVTANTVIAPRVICTDSDPLVPNGTSVVLYSEIRADNVITDLVFRSDTHTITLEQTGEVKVSKTVDVPLDDQGDTQIFNLSWSNFSKSIKIVKPVIIDVFPYNGDTLTPPSNFTGRYELVGEPTMKWTDDTTPTGSDPFPEMGVWYYTADNPGTIETDPDANAAANTTNWCLEGQFTTANCPTGFADVTAIKFISNYDLEKDGDPRQGMTASVTMLAGDSSGDPALINKSGDKYTNQFSFDSVTLPPAQYLKSNYKTVTISSFAVGDLVFADMDGNGKYDPSIDYPAPDGTVVNLRNADGSLEATTTTGLEKPGRYLFEKLARGNYYVEIPSSEFQPNKTMWNWQPASPAGAENDEKNEADDQHAFTTGSALVNGVRSNTITLSSDAAPPGGVPKGHEPLGDNTALLTNDTFDEFSNYTLDMGLRPLVYEVSGTVWNDTDNNGIRANSELGIAGVTVVLRGAPYAGAASRCISVDTDANGNYSFGSVIPGSYTLIESDASAVPFGTATCPPVASDPNGFISTTPNTRQITVHNADVKRQDFGDSGGIIIKGNVFGDNGLGGGTSVNGIQESTERGIGGVTVKATNASGTLYDKTITATDGSYELHVPGGATVINITESNLTGYVSTGATIGNSAGAYDLNTDTIRFSVISGVRTYTGLDFGDVKTVIFEPNHQSEILPGNVVFYAHKFSTPAQGVVKFTTPVADLNTASGWSHLIYRDANCNGVLDGAEANTAINGMSIGVGVNGNICIINKVYAPANVPARDRYRVRTDADFNYDSPTLAPITLSVTDITTAGQKQVGANPVGESGLELRKSVQNLTTGAALSEDRNMGSPGDILRYRVVYRNKGIGPITGLTVNDNAPAQTVLQGGSADCDLVVTGMTCTPVESGSAVRWEFTGTLPAGAAGRVSFTVKINQ